MEQQVLLGLGTGQPDFLAHYRAISSKLKKRWLKKPNVAEASEQFRQLAKAQEHDYPHYSAFSCLAMARCEHTLGNPQGEVQALTRAARSFMDAERLQKEIGTLGFEENLAAAMNCYSHAIRVHSEHKQFPLAAALCRELGNALKELGKPREAITHYQRAAEPSEAEPLDCSRVALASWRRVPDRDAGDYDGALAVLTEMAQIAEDRGGGAGGKPMGAYSDMLAECEVTRVLLLMLLRPTPQRTQPAHSRLLEKYAWASAEDAAPPFLSDDLFLLLQSLVMACQSRDLIALPLLQADLQMHLSVQQSGLLHKLVSEMLSRSKELL
ncbi:PREDICTED: factor VIII intron 22 protein-like isoform X2 [Priapulus caudatus]|uniref:Factor VIII intron 22 protein-like isoform X1 n=1 Tax=Priapulus caudatus TaxID=37621 RepID=A0ABM1F2Q7_PRICU|nr:PREDICTED: factor VIII intron 22 protein-like isoform X1 [Priapulus caudatus]XP_014678729.1 PREDICTED: factor VIII intron 22 protein-like isoform X2 [Priapulus caudatus]